MSELISLMNTIGVTSHPKRWDENFAEAKKNVASGLRVLNRDYLTMLNTEYGMFSKNLDYILYCADKIRENPGLKIYVALLALSADTLRTDIWQLTLPKAPEKEDSSPYTAASMFGLLGTVPASISNYRSHNVPESMIRETINVFEEMACGIDIPHLAYMGEYIQARWFHIGNLSYEILNHLECKIKVFKSQSNDLIILSDGEYIHHTGRILGSEGYEDTEGSFKAELIETEGNWAGYPFNEKGLVEKEPVMLDKNEWSQIIDYNSEAIMVHIPPNSLDPQGVSDSLNAAVAFFRKNYPEFNPVCFFCSSWIMNTELWDILNPKSRIVLFSKRYKHFSMQANDYDTFYFIFDGNRDIPSLPETTSLERAIKKHFLSGNHLLEGAGILPIS